MKVAHIAPPWISIPPKNYGGTEFVLYNLVEEQVAQGHDVTLFAPGDAKTSAKLISFFAKSLADTGVPWSGHLKAYYHMHKAVEYIKEHDFDIVHAHLSSSADMYVFPLTAQMTTPLVVTLHSRFPFDRVQSWTGDADKYFMDWLSPVPVVAISESARAEVKYPLNFVGIVHHGIPLKQFRPVVAEPENFVAWLGRLVPEKGAHLAIKAAEKAGVPIVLAGTIDRHVRESVSYFNDVIKPLIDHKQVKYIGPVNTEQKIHLFSRARGFLNPIEWEEPFGMVMIEAMSVGCPVISFTRGAAPEIVSHKKNGFLVHNVSEMAHFIPRIAELDRAVVRAYAEKHFSITAMAEKYTRIYRKVTASSRLMAAPSIVSAKRLQVAPSSIIKTDESVQVPFPSVLARVEVERRP
jgi:glycosyltransferase involved in cell wall biosynthesis